MASSRFNEKLNAIIDKNDSLVCVGLDPVQEKLPTSIGNEQPLFEFCKAIVDVTASEVCAFKPNSAFFEAEGAEGIAQLKQLCDYITTNYPDVVLILDAKRADIGNTNLGYVKYAYDYLGADAVTISPYMGDESVQPFLDEADHGAIILCRTSNPLSTFQTLDVGGKQLYEVVAETVATRWNVNGNCALVVGATHPDELRSVRKIVGDDIFLLVPGVGAQGGDAEKAVQASVNSRGSGIVVNASRSIIYASSGDDFAQAAHDEARSLKNIINSARR